MSLFWHGLVTLNLKPQQTKTETMKTIFKNLLIHSLLLTGLFFSCQEDDSTSGEETMLEDLSKLVEDEMFIEYVSEVYIVSQRIEDQESLRNLIESNENLTVEEETEVALLMGFANLAGLRSFHESQVIRLSQISDRYDIENKNSTDFAEIFYQTVVNIRNERLNYSTGRKSATTEDIGEFCEQELAACDDALFSIMNPNMDADVLENFFCSAITDEAEYANCVSDVNNLLSAELSLLTDFWCDCLRNVDCGWTDEIDAACNF